MARQSSRHDAEALHAERVLVVLTLFEAAPVLLRPGDGAPVAAAGGDEDEQEHKRAACNKRTEGERDHRVTSRRRASAARRAASADPKSSDRNVATTA
jgi:hypothetical protein